MADTVLIHAGELHLKGANRPFFERLLMQNVSARLAGTAKFRIGREQGNFLLLHDGPLTADDLGSISARLRTVFGIAKFIFADRLEREIGAIETAAVRLLAGRRGTFRISSSRSDKSFPLTSVEIDRQVGAAALRANPALKVDIKNAEHEALIVVTDKSAYVGAEQVVGLSGLPTGSSGKVAALLSGGIDSPVAAWQMMRRGCEVVLVHCHSYPFVSRQSVDKVRRLAERLAEFQGPIELRLVPIGEAQQEIVAKTSPATRILLYRRLMFRVASLAAEATGALGLVTGDSVGQVASQTLENLQAVSTAVKLPIYRPLIGENKDDIVRLARTIGTYEISIEPHDDCCSLFLPPKPETRAKIADLDRQEAKIDAVGLANAAWRQAETIVINSPN